MDELLENWMVGNVENIEPISSYWGKTSLVNTADGRSFVLKEKSDFSRLELEAGILMDLSKVGAPVAVPIPTVDGNRHAFDQGRIYCLYPRLPGSAISEHYAGDAIGRARAFGKAIGFLHSCFEKCRNIGSVQELNLIDQVEGWAIPCIRRKKEVFSNQAIDEIWSEYKRGLAVLEKDQPKQLIHRDLTPANMLFQKGRLTGFVDFDMVMMGQKIFDVGYCGTSLLVSGFQDSEKVKKWPRLFQALVCGYRELCSLTLPELHTLPGILVTIQLLFMAFSIETHAEDAARCNMSVLKWLSTKEAYFSLMLAAPGI